MAKVDFRRVTTNAEVENIDVKDGQFIVTGEGKTFVDFGNERKPIAGTPDTQMSDTSTNSVENKVIKEYVDEIGTTVNLFGDVCSAESDTGTASAYSHITATKINATDWKFDIEGQLDISNAQHNYNWGIRLNRISTMLNNAIGIKVGYHTDLVKLGHWEIINPTTKLTYADKYGYGTTFGYEMSRYYTFCRYYTTAGAVGSWALDNFATGSILRATIYLREIA